jgi:hypothetical protein
MRAEGKGTLQLPDGWWLDGIWVKGVFCHGMAIKTETRHDDNLRIDTTVTRDGYFGDRYVPFMQEGEEIVTRTTYDTAAPCPTGGPVAVETRTTTSEGRFRDEHLHGAKSYRCVTDEPAPHMPFEVRSVTTACPYVDGVPQGTGTQTVLFESCTESSGEFDEIRIVTQGDFTAGALVGEVTSREAYMDRSGAKVYEYAYEGLWLHDERHGQGRLVARHRGLDGATRYEYQGAFEHHLPHGDGVLTDPSSGRQWVGTFCRGAAIGSPPWVAQALATLTHAQAYIQ